MHYIVSTYTHRLLLSPENKPVHGHTAQKLYIVEADSSLQCKQPDATKNSHHL